MVSVEMIGRYVQSKSVIFQSILIISVMNNLWIRSWLIEFVKATSWFFCLSMWVLAFCMTDLIDVLCNDTCLCVDDMLFGLRWRFKWGVYNF